MIAFAGAMRLQSLDLVEQKLNNGFTVHSRWDLEMQGVPSAIPKI